MIQGILQKTFVSEDYDSNRSKIRQLNRLTLAFGAGFVSCALGTGVLKTKPTIAIASFSSITSVAGLIFETLQKR